MLENVFSQQAEGRGIYTGVARVMIERKYADLGGPDGPLGYPVGRIAGCADERGYHLHFQYGSIYWSPETGAHGIHGAIRDKWIEMGWEQSVLGYPVSDERRAADGTKRYVKFERGIIFWSPADGVSVVMARH